MARKNWEEKAKERFQNRQDNFINKPLKNLKIEPKKFYPFPEYPDDVVINGYKESKGRRYIEWLNSPFSVIYPAISGKKEIIFEDMIGLCCVYPRGIYSSIYPGMLIWDYYENIQVNFLTKDSEIVKLHLIDIGVGMARAREIIIANGDTDEWTRVDFETASTEGRVLLSLLKVTISDKIFDIKRKCWFIHADTATPFLAGVKVLINNGTLGGYSIIDNRISIEAFDSFFNETHEIKKIPVLTKGQMLKELEHICKEQAGVIVSIREDADISSLKPYYRKAALALHPDRNNGDGSRMSHLNMIWAQLQQLG